MTSKLKILLRPHGAMVSLALLLGACATQNYEALVQVQDHAPYLEGKSRASEQRQRLQQLLGTDASRLAAMGDIIAALDAEDAEELGDWEKSAKLWLQVLQLDKGVAAARAFERWVRATDRTMGQNTSDEVVARLLLAQTREGQASPWLQRQNLNKLEKLSQKIGDLRRDPEERKNDVAWPPDPTGIGDDPFWDRAVKLACNREQPASWQKWEQQLSAGRRAYWKGLLAFCRNDYGSTVTFLKTALQDFEKDSTTAVLAINAVDRLIQAQKRLGRREDAAEAYRLQHKLLLGLEFDPATVGWTRFSYLQRQIEAGLWVGRMQSLLGDYQNAKIAVQRSLDLINQGFGGMPELTQTQRVKLDEQKADGYHILASRIAYEQKDYTAALAFNQVALELPELGKEWRQRLLWTQGWYTYRLGDRPQAIKIWQSLLADQTDEGSTAKLTFWIGRAYEELGAKSDADRYFARLRQQFPLSFYHVVALPKLRPTYNWMDNWPEPAAAMAKLRDENVFQADAYLQDPEAKRRLLRAELSIAAGVGAWVPALNSELYQYVSQKPALLRDTEASLYVSRLLHMAGQHQQAILLTQQLTSLSDEFWEAYPEQIFVLYPKPFLASYQRSASQQYIDPELPLAITRQESSFQAEAVSPAEAVGLMQMMAATAEKQATRMGLKLKSPLVDLKRPELNINLGTAYLAELGRRYKGQWYQSFAAYNAGEYAVDAWIVRRPALDPTMWVESLAFGETSSYVKNVWRNWEVYRFLKAAR